MVAFTEDPTGINLLEKNCFLGGFVINQVIRQYDVRHIKALCFLYIQPV
jgi:hypothetical protein